MSRLGFAAAWLLCATLAAAGCGDTSEQAQKRELLTPRDSKLKLEQEKEKRRIFDQDGELIASGEKVGGVMLPKGLTLYRRSHEHSFYKTTQIDFEKLDRYFGEQLISTTVERQSGAVKFGGAVPRDNLKAPRLDLHLTRLQGAKNANEVYFRVSKPFKLAPPPPPPESAEARLRRAQQFRD
jgi:hypothetical protein